VGWSNHVAGGDLPPTLAGTPCYVAPVEGKGVDDIGKINQLSLAVPKLGCPGAVPRLSLWCPLAAPWIPWTSQLMTRRSFVENDNLQGLGSRAANQARHCWDWPGGAAENACSSRGPWCLVLVCCDWLLFNN